jgi:hypothetical protein
MEDDIGFEPMKDNLDSLAMSSFRPLTQSSILNKNYINGSLERNRTFIFRLTAECLTFYLLENKKKEPRKNNLA